MKLKSLIDWQLTDKSNRHNGAQKADSATGKPSMSTIIWKGATMLRDEPRKCLLYTEEFTLAGEGAAVSC